MSVFETVSTLLREGTAFVLATVIQAQGSTPQKPGSKMLILEDGSTRGTIGGGAIEFQVVEAAKALFRAPPTTTLLETHLTHDLGMCCGGKMTVFLEKHLPRDQLFLFGAGHVAHEVAKLAQNLDFLVIVIDERPEWASRERFPHAHEVWVNSPAETALKVAGGPQVYCCVFTHDHALDQACVEALVGKPLAYLGVIGSRRKAERFKMRLNQAGVSHDEWAKVKSPMGLAIEAQTPAEIAVSIVAELIQTRRRNFATP